MSVRSIVPWGLSLRTGAQTMLYLSIVLYLCVLITLFTVCVWGGGGGGGGGEGRVVRASSVGASYNLDDSRASALQQVRVRVVWTFLLSTIFSLPFLSLSGRRPNID